MEQRLLRRQEAIQYEYYWVVVDVAKIVRVAKREEISVNSSLKYCKIIQSGEEMASSEESHVIEEQLRMSQDEDDEGLHSEEQHSPSKLTIRDQIRLKKEKQRQEEEAQFTFRPAVNQSKKPQEDAKSNRFDKLYGDALKRHMTGQTKGSESPTKGDKELTFKPKLSSMGAKQSRSSSRERLGITRSSSASKSRDVSRERNGLASDSEDNQSQASSNSRSNSRGRFSHGSHNNGVSNNKHRGVAKALEEQQASMTFRPSITKRAKSIEKQRQPDALNVAERLYDQGKKVKEKMEQKKTELEQLRMQECTFAPSVVTKSKPLTTNLEVTERLRRFEEIKKKKLEEALRKKEEEEAEELTFKPKISPRAQSPSPHMTFSQEPLEERLMTPSKRRNSRAQEEATKELTFKPKLIAKRSPSVCSILLSVCAVVDWMG